LISFAVCRRKFITTSGFSPPSCNFWVKEASDEVDIYTSEKPAPNNIGTAPEIASISVSVVKLLVLPVWGTVSTSDLPDAVLPSRTMSVPVEVDRACPKTVS